MQPNRRRVWLIAILLMALILRLEVGLSPNHAAIYERGGGDSSWYLQVGSNLMTGYDYSGISIPTAPLYLVFTGLVQRVFEPVTAITVILILQAIMATATCYFVCYLAQAVSGREPVGLLAAGAVAVSPAFILEAGQVLTETLYIFLIAGGLFVYTIALQRNEGSGQRPPQWVIFAAAGILLGLAALTRAVLLLFPIGLALHLLLVYGWRRGLQWFFVVLLAYSLTVSTWTIYNKVKWDRWVVGAEGFWAFLYIGTTESGWQGASQTDQSLQGVSGELPTDSNTQSQLYQNAALDSIMGNLPAWLGLRAQKLTDAYLQPHGTTFFPGESLKDATSDWLVQDRTLSGLVRLTQGDAFWPKLLIYALHYVSLLAGLIGITLTRRNWRITLPLIGFILYTSLAHFVLEAIPRYIFPTEFVWWVFAACGLILLFNRRTRQAGGMEQPKAGQQVAG